MKKYLIYLTKSAEVVCKLFNAFTPGENGVERVRCGAGKSSLIPEIYLKENYLYCIVTYTEDAKVDPYCLVIA